MKKTSISAPNAKAATPGHAARMAKIPFCLSLAVLAAPPFPALAQEAGAAKPGLRTFNIGSQPLYSALSQLAEQGGIQFAYTTDMVKGLTSPGVTGQHTTEEALRTVLAGTGLSFSFSGPGTVTLLRAAPARKAPPPPIAPHIDKDGSSALPAVVVTANANDDPQDPRSKRYMVPDAATATKTDTPIMQTPVSIQVVPKAVMNDQQVVNLPEAVRNISGVQASVPGADVYQDGFLIRGFDSAEHTYRNGLRQTAFTFEPANLERVEVLKGPAGVLYGRSQPGGIINAVTKQPLADSYYSVQQQFGSYDLYRTAIDATGPLDADRSLLYRVNLLYRSNNSIRDFSGFERIMFAPSLSWLVSDRTRIDLSVEYQHQDRGQFYDSPVIGTRPVSLPRNTNLSEPFAHDEEDKTVVELAWSHQFNDNWTLRNRFQGQFQSYQQLEVYPTSLVSIGNTVQNRALYDVTQDRTTYATNLDLLGKFDTWDVRHEVLLGFDYYNFDWANSYGDHCCTAAEAVTPINIFRPVHGQVDIRPIVTGPSTFFYHVTEEWKGFYFQDQLSAFNDQVHLLVGGRHDWVSTGAAYLSGTGFSPAHATARMNANMNDVGRFSPRVGIVYQPQRWLSFYANYSEGFGSNNSGRSASGEPFAPETSYQYEVGAKAEAFDGRLRATLAAYEITKDNVLAPDDSTPDPTDSALIGKARSNGIEFDVAGQIDENWSLIAAYAHNDARIGGSDPNRGNRLPRAAENSGNAWVKYQFTGGWLDGLSLSTGAFLVGQRQGDLANSFQLPGYARWDMAAAYLWKVSDYRLTTRLNVNNVLDKEYFATSGSRRRNFTADPLTLIGSVQVDF